MTPQRRLLSVGRHRSSHRTPCHSPTPTAPRFASISPPVSAAEPAGVVGEDAGPQQFQLHNSNAAAFIHSRLGLSSKARHPMESIIRGKAYVLGDNIDTDQIIPAIYLSFD